MNGSLRRQQINVESSGTGFHLINEVRYSQCVGEMDGRWRKKRNKQKAEVDEKDGRKDSSMRNKVNKEGIKND